jgi:hypothetical protein
MHSLEPHLRTLDGEVIEFLRVETCELGGDELLGKITNRGSG